MQLAVTGYLRLTIIVLLSAVMTAACAGSLMSAPEQTNGVQISLERSAFRSGDTVSVHIKNVSGAELTYPYGFCRTVLQQQSGTDWVTVAAPSDGCPLALGLLGSGATVTHTYVLPSSLPTGRYRLLLPSPEPKNAQVQESVATPAFTVNSVTL